MICKDKEKMIEFLEGVESRLLRQSINLEKNIIKFIIENDLLIYENSEELMNVTKILVENINKLRQLENTK